MQIHQKSKANNNNMNKSINHKFKKNGLFIYITWMILRIILLSERSQAIRSILCDSIDYKKKCRKYKLLDNYRKSSDTSV